MNNLNRFKVKQELYHKIALSELKNGMKESHWMWFIFPQIYGLGYSEMSLYYAIKDLKELEEYLSDDFLMNNYLELCNILLDLNTSNPKEVFGYIDAMKLNSSLTLFYVISENSTIKKVLDKYFDGKLDLNTLKLIGCDKYV